MNIKKEVKENKLTDDGIIVGFKFDTDDIIALDRHLLHILESTRKSVSRADLVRKAVRCYLKNYLEKGE